MLPLATITATVDQLDSAAGLVAGLAQARELTARHVALSRVRAGMAATMPGLFETLRGFDYCGTRSAPGTLVSRDLIPDGMLYRLQLGRTIQLAHSGVSEAVA